MNNDPDHEEDLGREDDPGEAYDRLEVGRRPEPGNSEPRQGLGEDHHRAR